MLKTAIKVFGTFRTKTGVEEFVARFSCPQTCRLRKVNRFDAIKRAFKGEAKQVLFGVRTKRASITNCAVTEQLRFLKRKCDRL